jgi:hypothetical protein
MMKRFTTKAMININVDFTFLDSSIIFILVNTAIGVKFTC